jgi:hypothetical protein
MQHHISAISTLSMHRRRLACSTAMALLAFTLISATVSAHAVDNPSPVHGLLDSGVIAAIAGGVVLALTLVWYRTQRDQTR